MRQPERPGSSAATTTTAAPATTAPIAIGGGSQFCTFAANAAKSEAATSAAALGSAGSAATSLKATYAKLQAEEPQILNAAPAAIKGDFQTLFTYLKQFYAEFAKVNFDVTKLPPSFTASLVAGEGKVTAASTAIETYLTMTCGVKTTTPST